MISFKNLLGLASLSLFTVACSSDDDSMPPQTGITTPLSYSFERDGKPTVSFSGQTTRIAMAEAFATALLENDATNEALSAIFAHEENATDFEDIKLNASDKNIKSKVAASNDFFAGNTANSALIKEMFDKWIAAQVDEVFPNWNTEATAGIAGKIQEAGGESTRYVNASGLEYNQVIAKGLIGALMTDQALNNYLSKEVLDEASNLNDNDTGILAEGKNYTTMEHKWDEAYGYIYGASSQPATPNDKIGEADNFLNKYIGRVEKDPDFTGIASTIFEAFKLGRAAIITKNYEVRDAQAAIIRQKISEIIGIRAVYYLHFVQ